MLIISATGSTNVYVTLYENCQNIYNPYFTWVINRKGSNDTVYFTNDDLSYAPYYWNEFQITPATNSNYGLTQGIIPLIPGEYVYNIWETTDQYDLNLTTGVGIVETGILIYDGIPSVTPDFTLNNNQVIPVFKPN